MAGKSTTLRNAVVDAAGVNSGAFYFAAHTGDPGTTGANEVTGGAYVRKLATPPAASAGTTTYPKASIPIPGNTTVTYWALYTTASGGTPYDSGPVTPSEVFGSPGTLGLTLTRSQPA